MPRRSPRTLRFDSLLAEVCAQLPLFEELPHDTILLLSAPGFGRGFLTASLRARLRKAGFHDLAQLAQATPDSIAKIRKFGPVRVERIRTMIHDEVARWLPGARATHAADATRERRLDRLRGLPVGCLSLDAAAIAALGLDGASCADIAGRSRLELIGTGVVTPGDVDRIVTALARRLDPDRTVAPRAAETAQAAPAAEAEDGAARRAALLAEHDREWEAAAPAGKRRRAAHTD